MQAPWKGWSERAGAKQELRRWRRCESCFARLGRAGRPWLKLPGARMKPWEWWKGHGRWDDRAAGKRRCGRVGAGGWRLQRKAATGRGC